MLFFYISRAIRRIADVFRKDCAMQKYTASFLGRDCPGVVATVSRLLGETGCNIVEVTQTILSGEFAAIFVVQAPDDRACDALREQLIAGLAAGRSGSVRAGAPGH